MNLFTPLIHRCYLSHKYCTRATQHSNIIICIPYVIGTRTIILYRHLNTDVDRIFSKLNFIILKQICLRGHTEYGSIIVSYMKY